MIFSFESFAAMEMETRCSGWRCLTSYTLAIAFCKKRWMDRIGLDTMHDCSSSLILAIQCVLPQRHPVGSKWVECMLVSLDTYIKLIPFTYRLHRGRYNI